MNKRTDAEIQYDITHAKGKLARLESELKDYYDSKSKEKPMIILNDIYGQNFVDGEKREFKVFPVSKAGADTNYVLIRMTDPYIYHNPLTGYVETLMSREQLIETLEYYNIVPKVKNLNCCPANRDF